MDELTEFARRGLEAQAAVDKFLAPDDTFPEWLYQRMRCHMELSAGGKPWRELDNEDKGYWRHEAAAFRRAIERNGFRDYDPGWAGP